MNKFLIVALVAFCGIHLLIVGLYGLITVAVLWLIVLGLPRLMTWNKRWWSNTRAEKVIHVYNDSRIVGEWGVFYVETGESKIMGNMVSRTIKVRREDGSIGLDYEWITEEDSKNDQWKHD